TQWSGGWQYQFTVSQRSSADSRLPARGPAWCDHADPTSQTRRNRLSGCKNARDVHIVHADARNEKRGLLMSSLILNRRDLEFVLYEWLQVEQFCMFPRYSDHSRETFDAVLDLCEQMANEHFASHNKKNDAQEPWFDGEQVHIIPEVKQALDVFAEAGLIAAGQDYELG